DAHAHGDVHVLVAVDVPEAGALGPRPRQGVEHLLELRPEADRAPAVSEPRPIALGELLGFRGLAGVARNEGFEVGDLTPLAPLSHRPPFPTGEGGRRQRKRSITPLASSQAGLD